MDYIKRNLTKIVPLTFLFLATALPVLAEEAEEAEEDLFFIEVIAVLFAVAALISMIQVAMASKGGMLAVTFNLFAWGVGFIAFATAWQGYVEFSGMHTSEFTAALFEYPIFLSLAIFTFGAYKAKKVLSAMK